MFQTDYESGQRIIENVLDLEDIEVRDLTELLAGVDRSTKEKTQEKKLPSESTNEPPEPSGQTKI